MSTVTDEKVAKKHVDLKNSAESRRIPFSLSLKRTRQLLQQRTCFYTGIVFDEDDPQKKRSIDRVLSDSGYTDTNTVACIVRINSLKANLTVTEIKLIYKGVRIHLKKQKQREKELKKKNKQTKKINETLRISAP